MVQDRMMKAFIPPNTSPINLIHITGVKKAPTKHAIASITQMTNIIVLNLFILLLFL